MEGWYIVSVLDVEYILCETIPNNKDEKSKKFQLKPDKDSTSITMNILNMKHEIKVKIIQFGVNSNKVTTGHELQGVSWNRMIVMSWNYMWKTWIYVVLSRVQTLSGLFVIVNW